MKRVSSDLSGLKEGNRISCMKDILEEFKFTFALSDFVGR
jgi:hypothetical protein